MSLIEKIFERYLSDKFGKKEYQKLFESIHSLSLKGMNIGTGTSTESSGERNAINYIKDSIIKDKKEKLVIFDVGANIGKYSLLILEIFREIERKTLYSFEPSSSVYEELEKNLIGYKDVILNNFGFGNENTKLPMYKSTVDSGMTSLYKRRLDHFNISMESSETVSILKIDDFCKKNNIETIDFMKVDVEGNELKVFEGAREMISKGAISYIQFEFGGCNIDSRTFFQDFYYFFKNNYIIYRIMQDGIYKLENYKEAYEIFTTTNFIVENKKFTKK